MSEEPVHKITVLCSECGALIEFHDVAAFLLGLHLLNACPAVAAVVAP